MTKHLENLLKYPSKQLPQVLNSIREATIAWVGPQTTLQLWSVLEPTGRARGELNIRSSATSFASGVEHFVIYKPAEPETDSLLKIIQAGTPDKDIYPDSRRDLGLLPTE